MKIAILSLFALVIGTASAQVRVYPPEKAAKSVKVVVRALSEVSGPHFRLGDISSIEAGAEDKAKIEQIDMGQSPVAGIPRPVIASRIQALMAAAGFKATQVTLEIPPDAKVALKVQSVTQKQFADVAIKAVQALVGDKVPLLCTASAPDFPAPIGVLSLESGNPTRSQTGYSVLVAVTVDGKRINSRQVNVSIDPAGMATAVRSGDAVKIILKSAGATIEVSGRAKTSGFLGQQISVQSSTGSIHTGIVSGAGQVEVKL